MDALITGTNTIMGNTSNINTAGILPRYYDSAPNLVITETSTIKVQHYNFTVTTGEAVISLPAEKIEKSKVSRNTAKPVAAKKKR